jgi:phage FluMu protein Com
MGMGMGGNCVCPSCGHIVSHQVGVPCNSIKCPKCGTIMVRQ